MTDWLRVGRIARFIMYSLYAAAGVFSWWNTLVTLQEAGLEYWSLRVWSIFLFAGGVAGMITAITDIWMFEYCGLALLGFVFMTFALSAALTAHTSPARMAISAIFAAVGLSCYVRWSVINRFARLSARRGG
jgi:hypothetical protein